MKKIQILGGGCPKCQKLAANAEQAAKDLGIQIEVEKVTDINDIMSYGVMMTPALVVDGVVKSVGKVVDVAGIKEMLS
jgi:small redox-active disulfide protein 2